MSAQRPIDKILSFPSRENLPPIDEEKKGKRAVHPAVRRRRLLWFGGMVVFVLWFLVSVVIQQFRIWNHQDTLAAKKHQIQMAEQKTAQLKESMKKLQKEDYLFELAHKLGYSYPDEENYEVQEKKR